MGRGGDVVGIHHENFHRLTVGICVDEDIAATAAGQDIRRKADRLIDGSGGRHFLFDFLGDRADGIIERGFHLAHRHFFIPFQKHVIRHRHDFCLVFNAESLVVNRNRIAQPEFLQRCHVLVFLRLPERDKGHFNACRNAGMRVVPDITLRRVPQLFLGRLTFKGRRQVKRNHHPVDEILRRVGIDHPLRQHEQHRLLRVVHARPEGQHARPDVPGIGGLFDVGHVLAPADHHTVVPSPVRMKFDGKFIPFVFARTVHIKYRP